jgi:hypothetical protein
VSSVDKGERTYWLRTSSALERRFLRRWPFMLLTRRGLRSVSSCLSFLALGVARSSPSR